jgi:UDP-N-acetylglucosamine diphosphorylase/glucosamine-1-phosphate N-acetyltransferase
MNQWVAVILAAGKGTRMKSKLPKVLHQVAGKSMVRHVADCSLRAGAEKLITIIGFGGTEVKEAMADFSQIVEQKEQLGTGHAVQQCIPALEGYSGDVVILCGDTPLLRQTTLAKLVEKHQMSGDGATVLTAKLSSPTGYGRIIRQGGQVVAIVEEKDATEEERQVREINTGIYCFKSEKLIEALGSLRNDNAQGEYYLTDTLAYLVGQDVAVGAMVLEDADEAIGVNSRAQLAQVEGILRKRKNEELMANGVTLLDPASTFIDEEVEIGADTIIYPFTWIEGASKIGEDCRIGPNTRLTNVEIGDAVEIQFAYAHDCRIDEQVTAGPYVHLRPDTHLKAGVKVGNFMEVKNSIVGEGTKLPHFSYIGDADLGKEINIGCGTITVNYDGVKKHRTVIEDGAFIGCNSNLVAPVRIEKGAYVGAGSTITKDVPAEGLGVSRAKQSNFEGWVKRRNKS